MAKTVVHYTPAQNVTVKAQAAVEAGSFVEIAGNVDGRNPVVKAAAAGATPFGVVAHDVEAGGHVMAYRAGHIVEIAASGSIAAGDSVAVAANGKAAKAAEGAAVAGLAVSAVSDGFVQVALA